MILRKLPPAVIVELELERAPRVWLRAECHEDEKRLRLWLRRAAVLEHAPDFVVDLLDILDAADERRAA